jgi:hypothetical protein
VGVGEPGAEEGDEHDWSGTVCVPSKRKEYGGGVGRDGREADESDDNFDEMVWKAECGDKLFRTAGEVKTCGSTVVGDMYKYFDISSTTGYDTASEEEL